MLCAPSRKGNAQGWLATHALGAFGCQWIDGWPASPRSHAASGHWLPGCQKQVFKVPGIDFLRSTSVVVTSTMFTPALRS